MRIAIASTKLDPNHGGAESWTAGLARWLCLRGHEVHLVGVKMASDLGFPEERIHVLPPSSGRMQAADALSRWLEARSFDVVHDMGIGYRFDVFQPHCGSQLAMENGKHCSLTRPQRWLRNLIWPFAGRRHSINRLSQMQFSQSSARFVAVSNMVARDLANLQGVGVDQVVCIPNGVDIQRFHPNACTYSRHCARQRFAIACDAIAVSVIAHHHQLKGVPLLLRALRDAHDLPKSLHLLVVGGHKQSPQSFSVGRHQVCFTGAIDDILPVFAATDIYLHPTFYDACSLAVLEAMACGIPAITTRQNGACERIRNGQNGFVIDSAKDKAGLLLSIRRLLNIEIRREQGRQARIESERWSLIDNYAAVESLYFAHTEQRRYRNAA